ncbi:MAG: hypothetical protein JXQ90_00130 [Cyclobacteriaceae bacterium]
MPLTSFQQLFTAGSQSADFTEKNLRIIFSNVVYLSLSAVYLVFILLDFQSYFRPFSEQAFDQYIVPIFIFVSGFCHYLNRINYPTLGKLLFIVSWPIALHIVPIILLETPSDYYLAFPVGIIFHAVLIQILFSARKETWIFVSFLAINFGQMVFFPKTLTYFDTNQEVDISFATSKYYGLDGILYWLLFNLIVFYLLENVIINLYRIGRGKTKIENQKLQLEKTVEQLQSTQAQLVQSEKMASLGVLTGGIAHEINNPLNYIAGGLNELKGLNKNIERSEMREQLQTIYDQIGDGFERTNRVLKTMMTISPRTGENSIIKPTNPNQIVENSLLFIRSNTPHNVLIVKDLEFDEEIMLYPDKIHQVVFSLINNAFDVIKAIDTSDTQVIKISTIKELTKNGADLVLVIHNTGSKIPKGNEKRIFEPFFTTKEAGQGSGLGLWVAYELISDHGGTISATNVPDGVQFTVRIPVQKATSIS